MLFADDHIHKSHNAIAPYVLISVLNGALWDIGQVHRGIVRPTYGIITGGNLHICVWQLVLNMNYNS